MAGLGGDKTWSLRTCARARVAHMCARANTGHFPRHSCCCTSSFPPMVRESYGDLRQRGVSGGWGGRGAEKKNESSECDETRRSVVTAAHDSQIASCFPDRGGRSGLRLNHTLMVIEWLPHFKRCLLALINKEVKKKKKIIILFVYSFIDSFFH